jgi:hypothetical protein
LAFCTSPRPIAPSSNFSRTCLCALTRFYYTKVIFFESFDVTWYAGPAYVTTCVEASFGIICASIPSLKVFFKRYFNPSQFGSTLGSAFKSHGGLSKGNTNVTNLSTVDTDVKSAFHSTYKGRAGTGPTDVELKGISVTREVEVASAYREVVRVPTGQGADNMSPHAYSFGSEKPLQFLGGRNPETPWLDDSSANTSPEGSIHDSPV